MMYEEYEKKILKIRGVFEWIYKYRAIIISTVSLIMAGIIALLVTKGIIIDDKPCENAIVYGERLTYKSSAFMDVAKYEFSYSDSDEWFDEEPTNVGKYKMRAYNHGNFGIRYTGQIYYFEIKPKPIDLYIENTSFVYGDNIILNGDLRSGDKVSSFDIEYDEEYSLTCNAIPKNVKIIEDYAFCYCSSIENISLNNKITKIGTFAFEGQEISRVNYRGNQQQFANVNTNGHVFDNLDLGGIIYA